MDQNITTIGQKHYFDHMLGARVLDKLTLFKGIVVARENLLGGRNRYIVQAQELHEGEPVAPQMLVESFLDSIEATTALTPLGSDMYAEFRYNLGAEVRDGLTGYQGIIVTRRESLRGRGESYIVQAHGLNKKLEPLDGVFVDVAHIIVIRATTELTPIVKDRDFASRNASAAEPRIAQG